MDTSILELVQENILQALGLFGAVLVSLKSFAKSMLNVTEGLKTKVEKVEVEELKSEITSLKSMLSEIVEFEELKAIYSQELKTLPTDVKERYKEILEKYSGD